MKKSKEDIEKHFKKINKIKEKNKFRSGPYGSIMKGTKGDISDVLTSMDVIESIDEIGNNLLLSSLENNTIPFDMIYDSQEYFNITHSPTSAYSDIYTLELMLLEDLFIQHPEYINNNIIDIGCGDGIKLFNAIKIGIENKKIIGTVDYLGLDDSTDMLKFAKNVFYEQFYANKQKREPYIKSNNINPTMKKVRPLFQKKRIQEIEGIEKTSPKTIFFLGGTIGNFQDSEKEKFFSDINDLMQDDDVFVLGYFPLLELPENESEALKELQRNFFERERELYERYNKYYQEKEIDIKHLKEQLPGIQIGHEDFDMSMEYDEENAIIYDVRTYPKDIMYMGEVAIPKGSHKSAGTKLDANFFAEDEKHLNKNFVEHLYKTKENDELINKFLNKLGISPEDCFIEKIYNEDTDTFEMFLIPTNPRGIVFSVRVNGKIQKVKKYPEDKILLHRSQRFSNEKMKKIVESSGLKVIDDLGIETDLYPDQDMLKLLVIKK